MIKLLEQNVQENIRENAVILDKDTYHRECWIVYERKK